MNIFILSSNGKGIFFADLVVVISFYFKIHLIWLLEKWEIQCLLKIKKVSDTLFGAALFHDAQFNDSRFNDARFVRKVCLSLSATNGLAQGETAYDVLKTLLDNSNMVWFLSLKAKNIK